MFQYDFKVEEQGGKHQVVCLVYSTTSLVGSVTVGKFCDPEAAKEMVRQIKAGDIDVARILETV